MFTFNDITLWDFNWRLSDYGNERFKITQLMTGRDIMPEQSGRDISQYPVRLCVQSLSRPGEFEGISFELNQGEILGITGRLGAGRTELALTLFGMKQTGFIGNGIIGRKSVAFCQ